MKTIIFENFNIPDTNRGYLIFPCLAEPIYKFIKTKRTDNVVGIRTNYVLSNELRLSGRIHK